MRRIVLLRALLLGGVLAAAAVWLAGSPAEPAADPATRVLRAAQFAPQPQGPWQAVALPDTWAQRGQAPFRRGHYRIDVDLPAAPTQAWALRAQRLGALHEVRLNGQLIDGDLQAPAAFRRPMPVLVTVPAGLLRAGANRLEITVDSDARAGLSDLALGPLAAVSPGFVWGYHRTVTLPQLLNAAASGMAVFMLLLWWLRRSEAVLGLFGALMLLATVRNQFYDMGAVAFLGALGDGLFFTVQALSVALLGLFAMAYAGRRPAAYRAALWATALLLPLAGAWAARLGRLHLARAWAYPWVLVLCLPALWLLLRRGLARRSAEDATLGLGLAAVLASGAHDYLYQQGRTGIMDSYWLPGAVPLVMAIYAAALLRRLVGALDGVERLAATLEHRVDERTRELRAANAAKTRFLAAASHDLRQPLVSIGLLVGLLREDAGTAALQPLVRRLQEATQAMEGLLKRLLDLSRLESDTLRVQCQPVALQGLFDGVGAPLAELAQRRGLRLVLRATPAVVRADPLLLEQILRNLIGNAVRYTQRGGVLVAARRAGPGQVRLAVWDTGPGIAPEHQQAIFGEYVRLGAGDAEPDPAGAGLGLSIVRRCAELMRAPLQLRSRPGRGSCFSVLLPLAATPAAPAPAAPPPAPPASGC